MLSVANITATAARSSSLDFLLDILVAAFGSLTIASRTILGLFLFSALQTVAQCYHGVFKWKIDLLSLSINCFQPKMARIQRADFFFRQCNRCPSIPGSSLSAPSSGTPQLSVSHFYHFICSPRVLSASRSFSYFSLPRSAIPCHVSELAFIIRLQQIFETYYRDGCSIWNSTL